MNCFSHSYFESTRFWWSKNPVCIEHTRRLKNLSKRSSVDWGQLDTRSLLSSWSKNHLLLCVFMLVVVSNIVERIFQINDRRSQGLRGFYLFWFSGIRCVVGMRTVIQKTDFYQKINEPSLKYLLWSITFYRGFSKSMN